MCTECKLTHLRSRVAAEHNVVQWAVKYNEIRREIRESERPAKESYARLSSQVDRLEQALEKLDLKQARFIEQSDNLKEKLIQQITRHFEAINSRGLRLIQDEGASLRDKKLEVEKKRDAVGSRLKTVDLLLDKNSPNLQSESHRVLNQLNELQKTSNDDFIDIDSVQLSVVQKTDLNIKDAVIMAEGHGETQTVSIPLVELAQKHFVLKRQLDLRENANMVRLIHGEVWSCQDQGTIEIFTKSLARLRCLIGNQWGDVADVCQLPNGEVVLAGGRGLYLLTSAGETKVVIDHEDKYNSCVVSDDKLITYCYEPARLIVYDIINNKSLQKSHSIPLEDFVKADAFVTLAASSDALFACVSQDHKVFVFSKSGELLRELGERGSGLAGKLNTPFLCTLDQNKSMLIADCSNSRLQVCEQGGQWTVLDVQPPLYEPTGAVLINSQLCVSSIGYGNTLSLYRFN